MHRYSLHVLTRTTLQHSRVPSQSRMDEAESADLGPSGPSLMGGSRINFSKNAQCKTTQSSKDECYNESMKQIIYTFLKLSNSFD